MPTINDLLREFDDPPFTERDFVRDQAALQQQFLMTYGLYTVDDINADIRAGEINDGSELVDQWIALQQLRPYLAIDRPPKRGSHSQNRTTGRESGPFSFSRRPASP